MDIEAAREILSKVSYKQGWRLVFDDGWLPGGNNVRIRWESETRCVKTGMPCTLMSAHKYIELRGADEESLLNEVLNLACSLELHEVQEHFLYDRRRVFDPHAPGAAMAWARQGTLKMVA